MTKIKRERRMRFASVARKPNAIRCFLDASQLTLLACLLCCFGRAEAPRPLLGPETNSSCCKPSTNHNGNALLLKGISALDTTVPKGEHPSRLWDHVRECSESGEALPAGLSGAVSKLVARNHSVLQSLRDAAKCDEIRLSFGGDGPKTGPILPAIRFASHMLALHALILADAQSHLAAGEAVMLNLRLTRSLDSEHLGIQVRRAQWLQLGVESLEEIINRISLSTAMLDQIGELSCSLERHEASGVSFMQGITRGLALHQDTDFSSKGLHDEILIFPQFADFRAMNQSELDHYPWPADKQFVTDSYDQLLRAWNVPYPQRFMSVTNWAHERKGVARTQGFICGIIVSESIPDLVETEAQTLASLRLATIAVTLERYRAICKTYPQNLASLSPGLVVSLPLDPFDGNAMRYRKLNKGYILYSIGPDLKDDGGVRLSNSLGDVVFKVVNAPPLVKMGDSK